MSKTKPATIDNGAEDRLSFTHREGVMSKHNPKCGCPCCGGQEETRVQMVTLEDGRHAERHVSYDEDGNEVVEIFAEEKRPLKLEKRIVKEHRQVVARETHETIRDGEVVHHEVKSGEPDVPLQVRERIGVADHAKVVDGDYVRKDEIEKLVTNGVVAGVEALMESLEPVLVPKEEQHYEPEPAPAPFFQEPEPKPLRAQSIVEKNVADKKKNDSMINIVLGVILVAQLGFFGYLFLVM